jgi:hypothetical protein
MWAMGYTKKTTNLYRSAAEHLDSIEMSVHPKTIGQLLVALSRKMRTQDTDAMITYFELPPATKDSLSALIELKSRMIITEDNFDQLLEFFNGIQQNECANLIRTALGKCSSFYYASGMFILGI